MLIQPHSFFIEVNEVRIPAGMLATVNGAELEHLALETITARDTA
jgi:hypothetical protein